MNSILFRKLQLRYAPSDASAILDCIPFSNTNILRDEKIGILVSSRGIQNITEIVTRVVSDVKKKGAFPVIIPAMGSHGGESVEAQKAFLITQGITPSVVGAEIYHSGSSVLLGSIADGMPVYVNGAAIQVDRLIGINRVKAHPRFMGNYESGILKLVTVGLGGFEGAKQFHRTVDKIGFEKTLIESSKIIFNELKFAYFIAVIEDRIGHTYRIDLFPQADIYKREKELLRLAKQVMPRLPFSDIDILVINEMGKNYSGGGIDTCVVGGRKGMPRTARRIYVRRLSNKSEGNAIGVGLVDAISDELYKSIDMQKTYRNARASMCLDSAKIPIRFDTDMEALEFLIESLGKSRDDDLMIAIIDNTSDLTTIYVTPNLERLCTGDYTAVADSHLMFNDKGGVVLS